MENSWFFTFDEIARALNAEWLNPPSHGDGVKSLFTDTRISSPESLFLALSGETFDAHNYLDKALEQGAKAFCIERSKASKLPPSIPAILVDSTVDALQKLAHFHRKRFPDLKVVALTGSCGKTSTKETLRAIFEHAYGAEHVLATLGNTNNQIGVPQNLLRLTAAHRIAVIEMGTNHHGEIEPLSKIAEPDAALIVSIGNCHLEFLGSLEGVASEKSKIFSHLHPDGFAVIPHECPGHVILEKAVQNFRHGDFGFSKDALLSVRYQGGNVSESSFELTDGATGETADVTWSLSGRHQAGNAAGAAAVALFFGIPLNRIAEGIAKTRLPGMRMRHSTHHDALWINDAYNANPDSMKASLDWLSEFADPEKLLLVLGDMGEIGENTASAHKDVLHHALELFPEARILAVGCSMSKAASEFSASLGLTAFGSSVEAGKHILEFLRPGDLVFLKASRSTQLELAEPENHETH